MKGTDRQPYSQSKRLLIILNLIFIYIELNFIIYQNQPFCEKKESPRSFYLQIMNKENYSPLSLRSSKRSDGSLKTRARDFSTNTFQIRLNPKIDCIFHYDFKLFHGSTEVVKNSKLYYEVGNALKEKLSKLLGFLFSRGQTAYCTKDALPTSFQYITQENNKQVKLQAIFKKVKESKIKDMMDSPKNMKIWTQILNSVIKNKLDYYGMVELGKSSKYYKREPKTFKIKDKSDCIVVMQGFKMNVLSYQNRMLTQIEPSFRILQSKTMLDELKAEKDLLKYIGKSVTANYGSFRNYKIIEVDSKLSPLSSFEQESGISITYKEYMLKSYKKRVENDSQPLIKVLLRTNKFINKDGKIVKDQVYGYLIPQFVSLAGLNDSQMKSFHLKDNLSKETKLSPTQAIEKSKELIKQIQHNDLFSIENQPFKTQGYNLQAPSIMFRQTKVNPDQETGKIKMRQKLLSNSSISDYLIVHSIGIRNKIKDQRDYEQIDSIFDNLNKASESFDFKMDKPQYLEIERGKPVDFWISQIRQDCKKNGNPSILIFIFNRNQLSYYQPLKSFCCNTLYCQSQVITRQKFRNQKGRLSIASKIIIQISSKLSFPPYKLISKVPYIEKGKKNVMIGGITVTKGKHGSYVSFVGNISSDFTKYMSVCKKINSLENIPQIIFEQAFKQWAKRYWRENKAVPDYILILRQGANEVQLERSITHCEIPALESKIKLIGQKTKTKNYDPCRQIVLVNSRNSQKFFSQSSEAKQLKNPQPGSLITQDLDSSPSFNLISHHASIGTANPIKYKVVYEKAKISQQTLASIIHQQCFNYYNWDGPVKVPSCLQYASKLGKLTSMYLGVDQQGSLSETLYYL